MTPPTSATLRDWLLHRLPDAARAALEERLLREDALVAQLREAETDLIDDHAAGRLDAATRADVARHLIADRDGHWRWQVARALAVRRAARRVAEAGEPRRRWVAARPRLAAIGALAAVLVLAVLLVRPLLPSRPPADAATLPTVSLRVAATRGTASALTLPPNTGWLRLQVEAIDPQPRRYAVSISDGATVRFHAGGLTLRRAGPYAFVEVVIPAAAAGPGHRTVRLLPEGAPTAAATVWELDTTVP